MKVKFGTARKMRIPCIQSPHQANGEAQIRVVLVKKFDNLKCVNLVKLMKRL